MTLYQKKAGGGSGRGNSGHSTTSKLRKVSRGAKKNHKDIERTEREFPECRRVCLNSILVTQNVCLLNLCRDREMIRGMAEQSICSLWVGRERCTKFIRHCLYTHHQPPLFVNDNVRMPDSDL